jgi:hypothetical protein
VPESFFDRVERPVLAAWKAHLAAQQLEYERRMLQVRKEWRRWIHQLRWQRRLAQDRRYILAHYLLLILASGLLIWGVTR